MEQISEDGAVIPLKKKATETLPEDTPDLGMKSMTLTC